MRARCYARCVCFPPRPGGGGVMGKKKVCVPKIFIFGLLLIMAISVFSWGKILLIWVVGLVGWRWPVPQMQRGGFIKQWAA